MARDSPIAARLGVARGDRREFYSIFEAAADGGGAHERGMILRSCSAEEGLCLNEIDHT